MKSAVCRFLLVRGLLWPCGLTPAAGLNVNTAIVCQQETTPREARAAREVRRYVF